MNPIDDVLTEKKKLAAARQQKDVKLWEAWRKKPTKRNLSPLLGQFEGDIGSRVSRWKSPNVSKAAFEADLRKNAIQAFQSYDPNRGASLRTHVGIRLKRSQRFNSKFQNIAYIPEDKAALISPIQQAVGILFQEHEKEPTTRQIASYLKANPSMLPKKSRGKVTSSLVKQVQDAQIRDIPEAGFESDPTPKVLPKERQILAYLRPSLKPDEQTVFDYMYGKRGKPHITSTGQIATKIGKSPSQVSRLKRRIEKKFKSYL